jgi:methionine biosynthesis protein MetW
MNRMNDNRMKLKHRKILDLVRPGSSVLDLGCRDGELLSLLVRERKARAQGIEQDDQAIYACVARGISVLHGYIDTGLSEYRERSFDYVIFNESLQKVRTPDRVLSEALRVGREVIVVFPNFAHWSARMQMFFGGRAPVTPALPYTWHDTPNLHFLSISDFTDYCGKRGMKIKKSAFIRKNRSVRILPNLRAEIGIFLLASKNGDEHGSSIK